MVDAEASLLRMAVTRSHHSGLESSYPGTAVDRGSPAAPQTPAAPDAGTGGSAGAQGIELRHELLLLRFRRALAVVVRRVNVLSQLHVELLEEVLGLQWVKPALGMVH